MKDGILNRMEIATTISDFSAYTKDSIKAIEYIAECGFKNIDYGFDSDYKNLCGFFSEDYEKHLEKCLEIAQEKNLKFVQAHAPMGMPLIKDEEGKRLIDATKHSIKMCSFLGIKNIVVHSGYRDRLSIRETLDENKVFYDDILCYAEKFGVNVLTENFNKRFTENLLWIDNATELRELIELVNHPLFHACWDTGHGNLQDMPQHESLKILDEHVYALHVQDNFGIDDKHFAPFFGTLNIDSLMYGLREIGYNGYFTLEADNFPPTDGRGGVIKKPFDKADKLLNPPLEIKMQCEKLLYSIAESIVNS